MRNNHLCVVTAQSFPSGLASNNRILSYSKGLVELDYLVDVLSLAPSKDRNGTVSGVNYLNLGRPSGSKVLSIARGIFSLSRHLLKSDYKFLILVSNNAFLIIVLFCICKIKNISFIQEKSEFPFVLNYKGFLKNQIAKLYVNYIYKLFDGMIIMTNPLVEYFKNKTSSNCKLFLMPMTVDISRFQNVKKTDAYSNCITYCGYMGGNKDGVINLIESFSLIKDKHPKFNLLLLGTASPSEVKELKDLANTKAPNRVIFEGSVSREDIPFYLMNSKILALARPSSRQSAGGFPTKLGEYLATKKPVLVTAVGDIPKYLIHKKNAFVVPPDDNEKFSLYLSYIIENYEEALNVASEGHKLVMDVFNYKKQSVYLDQFLKSFK